MTRKYKLVNIQELYSDSPHHHQEYNYQKVDSFDPNLGNVEDYRYSPPYCQGGENPLTAGSNASNSNVTMIPNFCSFSSHENGLLSVAEAAQTIESGLLDQYNILPSEHHIITTFIRSITETDQTYKVPNRVTDRPADAPVSQAYQHYSDDGSGFDNPESMADTSGTTHLIFRRSPNGTSYQQIPDYVLRNEELQNSNNLTSQGVELGASTQHGHQPGLPEGDVYRQYENPGGTIGLIFSNEIPSYDENPNNLLIEEECHPIIDPNTKQMEHNQEETNNVIDSNSMGNIDKDQLLELTISPLLAAISNITDKESSRYWANGGDRINGPRSNLNYYDVTSNSASQVGTTQGEQIEDEIVPPRNDCNANGSSTLSDEYIDINDVKTIEFINKEKGDDDEWVEEEDGNGLRRSKRRPGGVKTTYCKFNKV